MIMSGGAEFMYRIDAEIGENRSRRLDRIEAKSMEFRTAAGILAYLEVKALVSLHPLELGR